MSNEKQGGLFLNYFSGSVIDSVQLEKKLNSFYWSEGSWALDLSNNNVYFDAKKQINFPGVSFFILEGDEFVEVLDHFVTLANSICPCVKKGGIELISVYSDFDLNACISSLKFFSNGNALLEEVKVENHRLSKINRTYTISDHNNEDNTWYAVTIHESDGHSINGKFYTDCLQVVKDFCGKVNPFTVTMSRHQSKSKVIKFLNRFDKRYKWINPETHA